MDRGESMQIGEIITDSLKYPLSNWKKFLILGIILVFSNILTIGINLGLKSFTEIILLGIIGLLIGILVDGYIFKILKSTLEGIDELPDFNAWFEMFINGIKMFIVRIVYAIPAILIAVYALLSFGPALMNLILHPSSTPSDADINIFLNISVLILIASLYLIIITPIMYMAMANMANSTGKLGAAFGLGGIFNKIGNIGWGNLIVWYIAVGFIYLALTLVGSFITTFGISKLTQPIIGSLILSLIVIPYIYMFLYRSVALVYKSDEED